MSGVEIVNYINGFLYSIIVGIYISLLIKNKDSLNINLVYPIAIVSLLIIHWISTFAFYNPKLKDKKNNGAKAGATIVKFATLMPLLILLAFNLVKLTEKISVNLIMKIAAVGTIISLPLNLVNIIMTMK